MKFTTSVAVLVAIVFARTVTAFPPCEFTPEGCHIEGDQVKK